MKMLGRLLVVPLLAIVFVYGSSLLSSYDTGWLLSFRSKQAVARAKQPASYDLQAQRILNRVVMHIKESYVDPTRVNQRRMIQGALEEMQRAMPELMVQIKQGEDGLASEATLRLEAASQTLPLGAIENRFQLLYFFQDVFRFIQEQVPTHEKLRDVEYAAINGMLSTLDPHSVLLTPEEQREMRLSTQGKFGGLGIVIGIRDGHLTVINPIEDTPASRAGLKANDQIVQINLDSTINMALGDAVDMMRGAPDTQVSIFVMREGWESPRRFVLTRANIRVKSVKSRSLPGGIGLVHIRNFQSTTFNELTGALETLSQRAPRRKLKGLILDLRGNPGGLLDQAIKISDLFISEGSLVKTVGYGARVQEPKNATRQGTRENLPVVVLVDRSSASASEIVAGALRNHQRALVIGQQTFGKGSVQLIFDNADESALKLTIAQYLTPGDISIQSVGITPHIKTIPVLIGEEETDLFRSRTLRGGESRLPEHLIAADQNLAPNQRPLFELTFLEDLKLRERKRDAPNELIVDFEIDFARRVLVKTRRHHFRALSAAAEQVISEEERAQEQKIAALLAERGVQWPGTPSQRGKGRAEISVTLDPPSGEVVAGETLSVRVDVKNQSQVPLAGLYALSESKSPVFDGHEFLFGEVPVGESRSWTTKMKVWPNAISRRDAVTLAFKGRGAIEIPSKSLSLAVKALPRPQLKLRYWLDDRKLGDGDGLLSPGEEVELVAVVRNEGPGVGLELVGSLSAEAKGEARGVFIKQGRIQPAEGTFAVGQEAEMRFRFQVKEGFEGRESTLFLNVIDAKLRDITRERVVLPLKQRGLLERAGQLRAAAGPVLLRSLPGAAASIFEARAVAQVEGCLPSEGDQSTCQWYRARSENGAFGWVSAGEGVKLSPATSAQAPAGEQRFSIASPQIEFINREAIPAEAPEETINLQGIARATRPLKDLMIYVNNQKVFFIKGDGSTSLAFNTTVPLEAGENRISIYARQDEEISGREVIIVHRPDDEKSAARSRRMRH